MVLIDSFSSLGQASDGMHSGRKRWASYHWGSLGQDVWPPVQWRTIKGAIQAWHSLRHTVPAQYFWLAKEQCGHRASRRKHLNKKEIPKGIVLFTPCCNTREKRNERNQPYDIYTRQIDATGVGHLRFNPYNYVIKDTAFEGINNCLL